MFQFPSNGKAYPKNAVEQVANKTVAPQVFQFPSNGKRIQRHLYLPLTGIFKSFNSLQTGKRIQSKRKGVR